MADVLASHGVIDDFRVASMKRSASQTSLCHKSYANTLNTSNTTNNAGHHEYTLRSSTVTPSSVPSSPTVPNHDCSSQASYISTPSSCLSLDDEHDEHDQSNEIEDIKFPSIRSRPEEIVTETTPGYNNWDKKGDYSCTMVDQSVGITGVGESPARPDLLVQSIGDDTALAREPSRHVDYLSHDWQEEDIWRSWRHIVSRRHQLENHQRLENASWRTWAKSRSRLRTVSPEKLNWMKDHDVTWLYGPLQTIEPHDFYLDSPTYTNAARAPSFLVTKPILKKRSVSEVMLRRSLSNCTLVRQAVDALATQDASDGREDYLRSTPGLIADHRPSIPTTPRHTGAGIPSPITSSTTSASGMQTPSVEKRHIHFNNKVEQCIAINKDVDDCDPATNLPLSNDLDESSDDGGIMMHQHNRKGWNSGQKAASGASATSSSAMNRENKTIAMLPSTTLNCRNDTTDSREQTYDRMGGIWETGKRFLSHASSSETLRPTKPSSNFLLEEDDDDDCDDNMAWEATTSARGPVFSSPRNYYMREDAEADEDMESRGLRRTASGMFMPYEEENEQDDSSIVGRVLDTVNTARDIAHVIWNVGWRR